MDVMKSEWIARGLQHSTELQLITPEDSIVKISPVQRLLWGKHTPLLDWFTFNDIYFPESANVPKGGVADLVRFQDNFVPKLYKERLYAVCM